MTNILLKRGTSNAISNYKGKVGEIVLDSSTNHIIIQDGSTKGGIKVANVDDTKRTDPYIIETYSKGNSWYRVWSDGWKEQGNTEQYKNANDERTITLIKPYKDTCYCIVNSSDLINDTDWYNIKIWRNSSSSFKICPKQNIYAITWYACGF